MHSAHIERAGSYLVHAHLGGSQIVDCPKLLQVQPGASAADRYSVMLTCRTPYRTQTVQAFVIAVASASFQACFSLGLLPPGSLDTDLRQACAILSRFQARHNAVPHNQQTCLGHHLPYQKRFRITRNAMLLPV